MKRAFLTLSTLAAVSIPTAATVYSTNFETNQSSAFTVRASADASANFQYNYSTYVPQPGTTGPSSIPAAPNGAGTTGLRLDANDVAPASLEAVTAYVNAASTGTQYTLKFDMWMQYVGDAGGGTGSTEMVTYGGHSDAGTFASAEATSFRGFFVTATGEGGAAQDYRYYSATSPAVPTRADTVPNWNGANELDNGGAGWQALLPGGAGLVAGTPGKRWVTVELVVNGSSVTIFWTPAGGTRTQVSSFTATGLTSGYPFVGYWDPFGGSIATPVEDNFVVIDNLSVTTPDVVNAANDWQIYQ